MKKAGYFDPWTVKDRLEEGWGIREISDAYGYHRKDASEVAQEQNREKSKAAKSGLGSFAIIAGLIAVLIWLIPNSEAGQFLIQKFSELLH
jgi:hypothetical protein